MVVVMVVVVLLLLVVVMVVVVGVMVHRSGVSRVISCYWFLSYANLLLITPTLDPILLSTETKTSIQ